MTITKFTQTTLQLPCQQTTNPTIARIPVHKLKDANLLARYRERLEGKWKEVKDKIYQNPTEMYKDYHKTIISAASVLYGRGVKTHFLPKEIVELRQKEMMSHNLYRMHEQ